MDHYEKLREKIDQSIPITTPATESKVEIEILKRILNPDEAEIACRQAGCDGFISKPLQFKKLFELMQALFDRQ